MKKLNISLFLALCLMPGLVAAADEGKALYATCVACHGAEGEGNEALKAPAIGGQTQDYLIRQLSNFKSGVRGGNAEDTGGAQMRTMAATLETEQAVEQVAAYIAAMPAARHAVPEGVDLRNGSSYYEAVCGACHGGKAEGNDKLKAPRLSNLSSAYMEQQYANYKSGVRGSHPEDKYGKRMQYMTKSLGDKDYRDVLAYIASLGAAE